MELINDEELEGIKRLVAELNGMAPDLYLARLNHKAVLGECVPRLIFTLEAAQEKIRLYDHDRQTERDQRLEAERQNRELATELEAAIEERGSMQIRLNSLLEEIDKLRADLDHWASRLRKRLK